jgi:hypothetical protein
LYLNKGSFSITAAENRQNKKNNKAIAEENPVFHILELNRK